MFISAHFHFIPNYVKAAFPGMGSPLLKKLMYMLLITLLKHFHNSPP